jgi:hypothetical protein
MLLFLVLVLYLKYKGKIRRNRVNGKKETGIRHLQNEKHLNISPYKTTHSLIYTLRTISF